MGNTRLFTLEIMWSDWKVRGQAVGGVEEFTFTTLWPEELYITRALASFHTYLSALQVTKPRGT